LTFNEKMPKEATAKIYSNFRSLGEKLTGDREFQEFAGISGVAEQRLANHQMLGFAWDRYEFLFVAYVNFLILEYHRKAIFVSEEIRMQREIQRQVEAQVAARIQQLQNQYQEQVPLPPLDPALD
jgi:hypothetical protein